MFSEFQNSMDLRSYRVAQVLNLLRRFQDLTAQKHQDTVTQYLLRGLRHNRSFRLYGVTSL